MYDFLIVGSGLFGCTFAHLAAKDGYKCLILEKRGHLFGNCYTENKNNIHIHKYGPHIFHTNNEKIWNFVNQFGEFNNFINRPKVIHNNAIYSFPINLFTLYQLWGVTNPTDAITKLESVRIKNNNPKNLEEWILSQVGEEIYYKFIYGYTFKQWNTHPKNLPSFIIKRLPIRLNFDDNYFNDSYQGIPINGYSSIMSNMIDTIPTIISTDYLADRDYWNKQAKMIVFTGNIDAFFNYEFGPLSYRSLRFETETININDYQGNAIINYTDQHVPYTRIIEHKHFTQAKTDSTVITREYPDDWDLSKESFYPINNDENNNLYKKYAKLTQIQSNIIFGGRLAEYQYYDMHQIIGSAFNKYDKIIKPNT